MQDLLQVDLGLAKKYNVPVPRYTSYPTALQFQSEFNQEALFEIMREDIACAGNKVSVYVHIPFCRSLCWYCGCTNVPLANENAIERYIDALEAELKIWQSRLGNKKIELHQLHFGGGTPNVLSPAQIERLSKIFRENFSFSEAAEISVELDPRVLTRESVLAFRRLGCSRASLGVQDLNPKVQLAIHRVQPEPMVRQAIAWLREAGFTSINVDLIYGLPFQSPETCEKTISELLALAPDRFAVFSYAHVPWLKPQQKMLEKENALPDPDAKLRLFKTIAERLTKSGFVYVGLDHFSREDDELVQALKEQRLQRNFQGYSTNAGLPIIAIGMSSISQSKRTFSQNEKTLDAYLERVFAGESPSVKGLIPNEEDLRRQEIIMRIMCDLNLDFEVMSKRFGCDFKKTYGKEIEKLNPLLEDGLIEMYPNGNGFSVTKIGRLFIRNIAVAFDEYFIPNSVSRHSKAI